VREVAAVRERHAEQRVARPQRRGVTAWLACEPECGCTFAQGAPNSFLARSMAMVSTMSTYSQPP